MTDATAYWIDYRQAIEHALRAVRMAEARRAIDYCNSSSCNHRECTEREGKS